MQGMQLLVDVLHDLAGRDGAMPYRVWF